MTVACLWADNNFTRFLCANNILGKYILSRSFHMVSHIKKASKLQKLFTVLKMSGFLAANERGEHGL